MGCILFYFFFCSTLRIAFLCSCVSYQFWLEQSRIVYVWMWRMLIVKIVLKNIAHCPWKWQILLRLLSLICSSGFSSRFFYCHDIRAPHLQNPIGHHKSSGLFEIVTVVLRNEAISGARASFDAKSKKFRVSISYTDCLFLYQSGAYIHKSWQNFSGLVNQNFDGDWPKVICVKILTNLSRPR